MQRPKRRLGWYVTIASLLAVLASGKLIAQGYDQQLQGVCKALSIRLISQGKTTAAVVDFTDLNGSVTALGRFVAEELSGCLVSATTDLQVIERLRLGAVLKEQKLGETPVIDPATAKKLGEIVGAQAIITGTLTPFGESVRLSVRALDVATARVIGAATADIPKTRAIEELLIQGQNRGADPQEAATKAQGSVGTAVGRPPSGAMPSEVTAAARQQTVAGVTWQLMGCGRDRTWVACRFMVSHNQNAEVRLRVLKGSALDDQRRSAASPGKYSFGYGGLLLLPGATEIIKVSFDTGTRDYQLSETATVLVSLQVQFGLGSTSRDLRLVRFDHVPIQ
jgi:hypothetical protein